MAHRRDTDSVGRLPVRRERPAFVKLAEPGRRELLARADDVIE